MSDKEKILKLLENIDDNSTLEYILEQLFLLYKIEKGLQDVKDGKCISTDEMLRRIEEW